MPNVNTDTIYQAGTVLADLVQQATGRNVLTPSTPGEFVSVAALAVNAGLDPMLNALSNMWSRTIFSIRPYRSKLSGLEMTADRYGSITRKLTPVSNDPVADDAYTYPMGYDASQTVPNGNGQSVDMYALAKKDVLQTAFNGESVYADRFTIFKHQLDTAFSSAGEFMAFNEMQLEDRANSLETWKETKKRGLLANMIAALSAENQSGRIIHLLTEYNTATGLSLTATTVMEPANYSSFIRWVIARVNTLARLMSERSAAFQTIIGGKNILRHTPANDLRVYLSAEHMDQMDAMALSITYHDDYLKLADVEGVSYWQALASPKSVSVKPTYTNTSGVVTTSQNNVAVNNIFGVMFDRDALGIASVYEAAYLTPFNTRGEYWNNDYHDVFKTRFDMTEKAVLLLLD